MLYKIDEKKIDEKWLCRADFGELEENSHVSEELEGKGNDFGQVEKTSCRSAFGELEKMSDETGRGGGLGASTIFKKFNEPYAPS